MTALPRNSVEVAIQIYDKARQLGLPVRLESSLVKNSDSRYVIIFPDTDHKQVIRISSHNPLNDHYALCIDVRNAGLLGTAVHKGLTWLEQNYDRLATMPPAAGEKSFMRERMKTRQRHLSGLHVRERGGSHNWTELLLDAL